MNQHTLIKAAAIWALMMALASLTRAQEEAPAPAIVIYRLADSSGPKPLRLDAATEKVQVQPQDSAGWKSAFPAMELHSGDRLKMEPYSHLDIRVEGERQGRLILVPNVLDQGGEILLQPETATPGEGIQVILESGALSAEWRQGSLAVTAYGVRTLTGGAKVSFLNDPESIQRLLFLESGEISLPDYPDIAVAPGEVVQLYPGERPVKLAVSPQKVAWLQGIINYNTLLVWEELAPPGIAWYRKPAFYVPVGLAAVAGGAYLISTLSGEDELAPLPEPPGLPR